MRRPFPLRGGEPIVTINGVQLTLGQTITMRVAISSFLVDLQGDPDCLGRTTRGA